MKKAIVLLLALAVLGGVAFAEDAPALKFSGALYGGLVYDSASDGIQFDRYYGSVPDAFRARINGSYTNGDVGVGIRLQSNDFTAPVFTRAFGWAKFFDGMLKVQVGKLGDYSWATSYNSYGHFDGSEGMQFIVAPIAGLSFGAFLPESVGADTVVLADQFKDLDLGVSYAIEGIGTLVAGYQMAAAADTSDAYFGFNLTAIENVTGKVEGKLTDLGNDVTGNSYFWERVGYTMDALYVGLTADQKITAVTTDALAMSFTPAVSYDIAPVTVGASFTYSLNAGNVDGTNTWSIDPYVTLPVSNSEAELGMSYGDSGDFYVYTMWSFNF